jgi:hypothetical protein
MAVNTPGMSPNLADYLGVKVPNEQALSRGRHNSGVAAEIRRGAPTFGTQASVLLSASGREAEGGTERTEGQTEAVATAISPSRS